MDDRIASVLYVLVGVLGVTWTIILGHDDVAGVRTGILLLLGAMLVIGPIMLSRTSQPKRIGAIGGAFIGVAYLAGILRYLAWDSTDSSDYVVIAAVGLGVGMFVGCLGVAAGLIAVVLRRKPAEATRPAR